MNTPVKNLVDRLLIKVLHRNVRNDDVDAIEALIYLNESNREIFRWFSLFVPWFVEKTFDYTAVPGAPYVEVPQAFTHVKRVVLNGKAIPADNTLLPPSCAEKRYSISGFTKISISNHEFKTGEHVVVHYMPAEIPELMIAADVSKPDISPEGFSARSIFPQTLDDVLMEYAMICYQLARGMISDPEESMRSRWLSQTMTQFSDTIEPVAIGEYWQGYHPTGLMV